MAPMNASPAPVVSTTLGMWQLPEATQEFPTSRASGKRTPASSEDLRNGERGAPPLEPSPLASIEMDSSMSLTRPPGVGLAKATLPSLPLVIRTSFALGRNSLARHKKSPAIPWLSFLPSISLAKLSGHTATSARARSSSRFSRGFSASSRMGTLFSAATWASTMEASVCLPSKTTTEADPMIRSALSLTSATSPSSMGSASGV
mmetsp:Transcript_2938/g.7948  ORF Transcript_2938/g.7948 Transcript_2938/m.7948 type:complete len:204 (+) Transcript_2938:279-890(+)